MAVIGGAVAVAVVLGYLYRGSPTPIPDFPNASILLLSALYFLPSLIAGFGKRRNGNAIFALNLLLGWTVIGWVVALVWSLVKPPATRSP